MHTPRTHLHPQGQRPLPLFPFITHHTHKDRGLPSSLLLHSLASEAFRRHCCLWPGASCQCSSAFFDYLRPEAFCHLCCYSLWPGTVDVAVLVLLQMSITSTTLPPHLFPPSTSSHT